MSNLPESRPNPFQRRYFAWAQPRYARMRCPLGAEAERIDRWLYSRAGLRAWIGLVAAIAVTAVGLVFGGLSWLQAIAAALVAWLFIAFVTLSAWMRPERYTARDCRSSSSAASCWRTWAPWAASSAAR